MIPNFKSKTFLEIRFHDQKIENIEQFIRIHPFCHCLKVISDFPQPVQPPSNSHQLYQIRIRNTFYQNEDILKDFFSGESLFCSLSSLNTGNGFFVQHSNLTFLLNESTYQRFGLSGKKHEQFHIILINQDNIKELERIQISESIEGILYTKHIEYYENYIEKIQRFENNIKGWYYIEEPLFNFDTLKNYTKLNKTWYEEFLQIIDNINLKEDEIMTKSKFQSITIEGFINLEFYIEWIKKLGEEHHCIIEIWDMKDIPGSFLGNKLNLIGFGGGQEIIFYNHQYPNILEIKSIEYMNEE